MQVLKNGHEVYLGANDFFKLLPDQFTYQIKINEGPPGGLLIRSVSQINTNVQEDIPDTLNTNATKDNEPRNLPAWMLQQTSSSQTLEPSTTESHKRPADFADESPNKKARNGGSPTELSENNQDATKSSTSLADTLSMTSSLLDEVFIDEPQSEMDQNHTDAAQEPAKIKEEPIESGLSDNLTASASNSAASLPIKEEKPEENANDKEPAKIKVEPIESGLSDNPTTSASNSAGTLPIKEEKLEGNANGDNAAANVPANPVAVNADPEVRASCQYGIRCYRATQEHRAELAHPGDADYRRPIFPGAPVDAPHCPFWAACYRRNPQHFQDYTHPEPSKFDQNLKNKRTFNTVIAIKRQILSVDDRPAANPLFPRIYNFPQNYDDESSDFSESGNGSFLDFSNDSDSDFEPDRENTTTDEEDEDGQLEE